MFSFTGGNDTDTNEGDATTSSDSQEYSSKYFISKIILQINIISMIDYILSVTNLRNPCN